MSISSIEIFSGESIPSFETILKNPTDDIYTLPLDQNFLVILMIDNPNNLTFKIYGATQVELQSGLAKFSQGFFLFFFFFLFSFSFFLFFFFSFFLFFFFSFLKIIIKFKKKKKKSDNEWKKWRL